MSALYLFRGSPAVISNCAFLASAAAMSAPLVDGGWTWPIQVIEAGWANGMVEDAQDVPQYISTEAVAQVAAACQSARFGRRNPNNAVEECDPGRIAGMVSDGHVEDGRALATLCLNPGENQIRAQLVAAKKAGVLDLFGLSVCGFFEMELRNMAGKPYLELCGLNRLISVDFVVEAGAGGKILPYAGYRAAASGYLPPEIAAAKEAENILCAMFADTIYLAAAHIALATAEAIQSQIRNEAVEATPHRSELVW